MPAIFVEPKKGEKRIFTTITHPIGGTKRGQICVGFQKKFPFAFLSVCLWVSAGNFCKQFSNIERHRVGGVGVKISSLHSLPRKMLLI